MLSLLDRFPLAASGRAPPRLHHRGPQINLAANLRLEKRDEQTPAVHQEHSHVVCSNAEAIGAEARPLLEPIADSMVFRAAALALQKIYSSPNMRCSFCLVILLLLVHGSCGVGHDTSDELPPECGVTPAQFEQHRWLMNVMSETSFPVTCCLFGQQMLNYMESAWLATRVLDRGLIEPSFVHQARDDGLYERMKAEGGFTNHRFHAMLGTTTVAGSRLFDPRPWTRNEHLDISAFATNKTFWQATGGTIDMLIVGDAGVIGGQACAHTNECNVHHCTTLDADSGPFPRLMEFFGRQHVVKKVTCLPRTERHLRGQVSFSPPCSILLEHEVLLPTMYRTARAEWKKALSRLPSNPISHVLLARKRATPRISLEMKKCADETCLLELTKAL